MTCKAEHKDEGDENTNVAEAEIEDPLVDTDEYVVTEKGITRIYNSFIVCYLINFLNCSVQWKLSRPEFSLNEVRERIQRNEVPEDWFVDGLHSKERKRSK